MSGAFRFDEETAGKKVRKYSQSKGFDYQGRWVKLTGGIGGITIKPVFPIGGDMFSHPHDAPQEIQNLIADLLSRKLEDVSQDLRWYLLQLVYNDKLREHVLQLSPDELDEELADELPNPEDRADLQRVMDKLQVEIEAFKWDQMVDDGDHFLLFPQTVETIAPCAWFEATWSFIEHFRSNFGVYVGEALLYSRVTIIGGTDRDPAVTRRDEELLKRELPPERVERIVFSNADELRRILDWGVKHDQCFGLGGEIAGMILASEPDDQIAEAIKAKFEPEAYLRQAL
jgi:hypothetical protein